MHREAPDESKCLPVCFLPVDFGPLEAKHVLFFCENRNDEHHLLRCHMPVFLIIEKKARDGIEATLTDASRKLRKLTPALITADSDHERAALADTMQCVSYVYITMEVSSRTFQHFLRTLPSRFYFFSTLPLDFFFYCREYRFPVA